MSGAARGTHNKQVHAAGGKLGLRNGDPQIREVFAINKLDGVLTPYLDEQEARQVFEKS